MKLLNYAIIPIYYLASCSSVSFKHPLPSVKIAKEQQNELRGSWLFQNSIIHMEFPDDNKAKLAITHWDDGQFKLGEAELLFTNIENKSYISLRVQPENKSRENYSILRYKLDDENLLLWHPNVEAFEVLIQEKDIEGEIEKDNQSTNILVSSSSESLLKLYRTNVNVKYNYEEPLILRRVTEPSKSNK